MATAQQLKLLEEAKKSLAKLKADDFSGISKENTLDGSKLSKAGTDLANKIIKTGTPEQKVKAAETQKTYLQSKLNTQKSLPTTTQQKTIPNVPKTTDRVTNTAQLSSALNFAVATARKARQSAELDFLGGVIPEGAVSAGTFTGLLSGLNRASTQFTQPLVSDVMDAVEADRQAVEDNQNSIRDLALSLVENGASQEAIQGVLQAPDIDSAIAMSAGVMQTATDDSTEVRQVGSNLVKVDKDGNVTLLFSGSSSGGGGGGGTAPSFTPSELKKLEQAGLTNASRQEKLDFLYGSDVEDTSVGDLSVELEASRGDDDYANTQLYVDAYQAWINAGKLPQDFFAKFDPDFYLNPNDPTIPNQIRGEMKSNERVTNPFG